MIKNKLMITASLVGALIAAPAFASMDKESDDKGDYKERYKEHFQQRHQMNMDMMQIMIDTMTILRDINHQPTAEEKKHLSEMIKQVNEIMARHKEMDEKAMQYMDNEMGGHMKGGSHHDMR